MLHIRAEIAAVQNGDIDHADSPLRHAPHTAAMVSADDWNRPYSRAQAAYPLAWLQRDKYWSPVGRIDNVYGDRNLVCACPSMEEYLES
jgi:glycine dehydrogenase